MLGRLFKLTSTQSLNLNSLTVASAQSGLHNSFEDSYTRGILYGLSKLLLAPIHSLTRRFRLLVAQDGGGLAAKQVLFDLFGDSVINSPPELHSNASFAGPDVPVLQQKLMQMTLNGAEISVKSPFNSSSPLPVTLPIGLEGVLDFYLSPDPMDLSQQLSDGHYFSRDNDNGLQTPSALSAASQNSPRLSAGGSSLRAGANRGVVQKPAHNINVLTDYMFGRGLPSNEWHTATKIHLLPALNSANETSQAVLITKLFLIVDATASLNMDTEVANSSSWNPNSIFTTRETAVTVVLNKSGLLRRNFSSRFSIGLIIPLDDPSQTVEETIASNWSEISMHLVILQKIVTNKLVLALKGSSHQHGSFIFNKRILLPSYMFQGDVELLNQLYKVIRLMHYHANVPRLISTHSLMTHTLNCAGSPFKANMINWALEVINWLEFKDGRSSVSIYNHGPGHLANSNLSVNLVGSFSGGLSAHMSARSNEGAQLTNTFLASLLALIISLRDSLSGSPLGANEDVNSTKEITRVVVMTSNSTVAKKLIFIICALIPDLRFLFNLENSVETTDSAIVPNGPSSRANEHAGSFVGANTSTATIETVLNLRNDALTDTTIASSNAISFSPNQTSNGIPIDQDLVRPIPIHRQLLSDSEIRSDDSVCASVTSTKGWEVPVKSTPNGSFVRNTINPTPTKSVAIAQQIPHNDGNGHGTSLAYLSSSLNSSLSSSASNYSLSKLGNSFMDKWKNSFVGGNGLHSTNHYAECFEPPMSLDSMRKHNSIGNKSPSPALCEENLWDSNVLTTSNSPMKVRCSRTQSVFNMCNELSQNSKDPRMKLTTSNIERTAHSVLVPVEIKKEPGNSNENIIRQRIGKIFDSPILVEAQQEMSCTLRNPNSFQSSADGLLVREKFADDKFLSHRANPPLQRRLFLQPRVAFVEEFRPEYVVQSCPVNPKLESQVVGAMKNDLLFYQNTCGFKKVVSKTVYINLRARDIKLIELRTSGQEKSLNSHFGPTTPTYESPNSIATHSPITSYFSHDVGPANHERRGSIGSTHKTTIRKLFSPGRNSGDKELINIIESRLERLTDVVSVINGDPNAAPIAKQDLNKMLFKAVRDIIS